jgi:hypothetical protein
MSEREIIEEFAGLLRDHARAQKEILERLVNETQRTQEVLVDRVFELLELRRGPPPPPPSPPLRMN